MTKKSEKIPLGVGLDVGTMNFVSARKGETGVVTKRMRDAFLDLKPDAKKMLRLTNVEFIERGGELLIVGDAAIEIANMFGREARRPLSQGMVSAGEVDALEVLGIIAKGVLGEPQEDNEICYFSVPAAPVDAPDKDVIYHQGIFERIITECGFDAIPSNEAMAIIFSETAADGFSGLGLSFGAGMVNIALAINTIEGMVFSVTRAGDWIDAGAARAVGSTQARMCAIKEKGLDLMNPVGRDQEALVLYYKSMIEYALDHITQQFRLQAHKFVLPRAIPLVVSGGTSLATGFLDFFMTVFEKKRESFPIEISDIRQAKEPLNAVAQGLLIQAMQEYE